MSGLGWVCHLGLVCETGKRLIRDLYATSAGGRASAATTNTHSHPAIIAVSLSELMQEYNNITKGRKLLAGYELRFVVIIYYYHYYHYYQIVRIVIYIILPNAHFAITLVLHYHIIMRQNASQFNAIMLNII
jgi:hypothetical protein